MCSHCLACAGMCLRIYVFSCVLHVLAYVCVSVCVACACVCMCFRVCCMCLRIYVFSFVLHVLVYVCVSVCVACACVCMCFRVCCICVSQVSCGYGHTTQLLVSFAKEPYKRDDILQ